jgi:exonuclease V gamma subunit
VEVMKRDVNFVLFYLVLFSLGSNVLLLFLYSREYVLLQESSEQKLLDFNDSFQQVAGERQTYHDRLVELVDTLKYQVSVEQNKTIYEYQIWASDYVANLTSDNQQYRQRLKELNSKLKECRDSCLCNCN